MAKRRPKRSRSIRADLQQKARALPYVKIGRRVWFDPKAVRATLTNKHTIGAKSRS